MPRNMSCDHPREWRLWPSNWEWWCLLCDHREPGVAVGLAEQERKNL